MRYEAIQKAIREKISPIIAQENLNLELQEQEKKARQEQEYNQALQEIGIEVLR